MVNPELRELGRQKARSIVKKDVSRLDALEREAASIIGSDRGERNEFEEYTLRFVKFYGGDAK